MTDDAPLADRVDAVLETGSAHVRPEALDALLREVSMALRSRASDDARLKLRKAPASDDGNTWGLARVNPPTYEHECSGLVEIERDPNVAGYEGEHITCSKGCRLARFKADVRWGSEGYAEKIEFLERPDGMDLWCTCPRCGAPAVEDKSVWGWAHYVDGVLRRPPGMGA